MRGFHTALQFILRSLIVLTLLVNSIGIPTARATQSLAVQIGPICIWVFQPAADNNVMTRDDLAERVSNIVRVKVEAAEQGNKRKVWARPDCIKVDQVGFDRQLMLQLSVKRQVVVLDGHDVNVVIAGGVSTDGLFQDRELQPVIILQRENISDDAVVNALVEFVDRTVVAALRQR